MSVIFLKPVLLRITGTSAFILRSGGIEVIGHLQADTARHTVIITILADFYAVCTHLPLLKVGIEDVVDGEVKGKCTI